MPRRATPQQVYRARPVRRASARTRSARNPSFNDATVYSRTVTNAGTIDTAPTISIAGPIAAPTISFENVTQAKTLWVNVTVGSGQTLVVDFGAKTVTLAGVVQSNAIGSDSRWWTLSPGANTVRSNVAASVSHRDAYSS